MYFDNDGSEELILNVIDMNGRLVRSEKLLKTGNNIEFKRNDLKSGLYMIQINSTEYQYSAKLAVE